MRSGPLRQRVTLQVLAESKDSYGQLLQSWTDVGTYWAEVRPNVGRELVNAAQVKADLTHLVKLRFIGSLVPGRRVKPSERLVFKGRFLSIIDVRNLDERNRELQLHCQELVSA